MQQQQQQQQHKEEEYTDYSCSTAVERLSRDIESLLRSWHIHNGCDRHFSVSTNPKGLALLRAERLVFVASLPDRQSLRLELELALWDGPALIPPKRQRATGTVPSGSRNSQKKWKQPKRSSITESSKKRIRNAMKKMTRRGSLSNDECQDMATMWELEQIAEEEDGDIWNQPDEQEEESETPAFLRRRKKKKSKKNKDEE
jgi:hypothetical protein